MVGSQRSTSIVYANETTQGEGWQCQKDQSCDWKSRAFFVSHDNSPATGVEVGRARNLSSVSWGMIHVKEGSLNKMLGTRTGVTFCGGKTL